MGQTFDPLEAGIPRHLPDLEMKNVEGLTKSVRDQGPPDCHARILPSKNDKSESLRIYHGCEY